MPNPLVTALALIMLVAGTAASADQSARDGHAVSPPPARAHAEGLTLDEAVAKVEAQYGARAVRADEERDGDRRVYRIRLLSDDGRVFDVTVDAASGEVE